MSLSIYRLLTLELPRKGYCWNCWKAVRHTLLAILGLQRRNIDFLGEAPTMKLSKYWLCIYGYFTYLGSNLPLEKSVCVPVVLWSGGTADPTYILCVEWLSAVLGQYTVGYMPMQCILCSLLSRYTYLAGGTNSWSSVVHWYAGSSRDLPSLCFRW